MSEHAAPRRPHTLQRAGLTLVETMLLVSIGGVLLAVGIPAFVRALQTSKLAEPPSELSRIYAAAATYYATPPAPGARAHCLPPSAGPTPAQPSKDPVVVEFASGEGAETWRAFGYEPRQAIRFRYAVQVKRPGCGVARDVQGQFSLSIRAEGDLDGDGVLSLFERNVRIERGEWLPDPLLIVRDAVE